VLEAVYSSLGYWLGLVGRGSEGATVIERDGVLAALVPVAPERSVLNSVIYEHVDGLRAAYDEIAAAYDEIRAQWTVWVRPADGGTAALLAERGHVLDAEPEAMARTLDDPPERPSLDLEWTAEGSMGDVGALNDVAYGYTRERSFAKALSNVTVDAGAVYVAHSGGEPVGCLLAVDHGSNADIEWVAVAPEARGRGLSGKLLAHALADAAERGQTMSTLVATQLGRPVYERLGFLGVGALQMWERRRPSAG
jgi:GNAT superfamily N-acetyltransferase